MNLSKLTSGETFLTDTNIKFQKLLMTKQEERNNKDRFKCLRVETGEIYWLTNNMIIRNNY